MVCALFWIRRSDWHLFLTIEERQTVRNKIKEAYQQRCPNYEELLEVRKSIWKVAHAWGPCHLFSVLLVGVQTCVAIEEELLYMFVPSRLDYFKSGMQYDKRVQEKRKQLSGQVQSTSDDEKLSDKPVEEKKTTKRGRHT